MHISNPENLEFTVKGGYRVTLFDTLSGEILPIEYENDGKVTRFYKTLYELDTLLVRLEEDSSPSAYRSPREAGAWEKLDFQFDGEYELHEPNVLLLDIARYSLDGGELSEREEIMRIDSAVRGALGLPLRKFKVIQPWAAPKSENSHRLKLVYSIESEIELSGAHLATEHPETLTVSFNGEKISNVPQGFYVDKEIKALALPKIRRGENTLEIEMPFGERVELEASYLIGDFGTKIIADKAVIKEKPEKLYFGDVASAGFSFYGGNIDYTGSVFLEEDGDVEIRAPYWRGALVGVKIDGEPIGKIVTQPYALIKKNLSKGKHKVTFTLFGTRYNTFSALHNLNADKKRIYIGPDFWRSEGDAFGYEYNVRKMGILSKPRFAVRRKK